MTERERPTQAQLDEWESEGVAEATDGCGGIELDGVCEHGAPSWFRELGLI
jgi:hypothetical protein